MSARANPRLVGVFVLVAVALFAFAVVLLTGADWFVAKERYAVFFPGSVKGLNRGAPVTFRGVKIGEVAEIAAYGRDDPDNPVVIEVVLEVDRLWQALPGAATQPRGDAKSFARSELGQKLRARMMSQSMLTGQRYIDVDFMPDAPARRTGLDLRYPEIATTPTAMEKMSERAEEIFDKLAELPIEQMLEDLRITLASLRTILESPDLRGSIAGMHQNTKDLGPVLVEARAAIGDLREVLSVTKEQVDGAGTDVRQTMEHAARVLEGAEKAFANLDSTITNADQAQVTAVRTLLELQQTLGTVRSLVEYLQTHPEAIVLGKQKQETK